MAKRKGKRREQPPPVDAQTRKAKPPPDEYVPPAPGEWKLGDTIMLHVRIRDGDNLDGTPRIVNYSVELYEPSLPELEAAAAHGERGMGMLYEAAIVDKDAINGRYLIPVMEAMAHHFTLASRHTTSDTDTALADPNPMDEIKASGLTGETS